MKVVEDDVSLKCLFNTSVHVVTFIVHFEV